MPELLQYFKSYSEFYTDTTYEVPENINQSFTPTTYSNYFENLLLTSSIKFVLEDFDIIQKNYYYINV